MRSESSRYLLAGALVVLTLLLFGAIFFASSLLSPKPPEHHVSIMRSGNVFTITSISEGLEWREIDMLVNGVETTWDSPDGPILVGHSFMIQTSPGDVLEIVKGDALLLRVRV